MAGRAAVESRPQRQKAPESAGALLRYGGFGREIGRFEPRQRFRPPAGRFRASDTRFQPPIGLTPHPADPAPPRCCRFAGRRRAHRVPTDPAAGSPGLGTFVHMRYRIHHAPPRGARSGASMRRSAGGWRTRRALRDAPSAQRRAERPTTHRGPTTYRAPDDLPSAARQPLEPGRHGQVERTRHPQTRLRPGP